MSAVTAVLARVRVGDGPLAVAFDSSGVPCGTAATVEAAVHAPVKKIAGPFAMEGGGSFGGCQYAVQRSGYPTVEVVVQQHHAAAFYGQSWQATKAAGGDPTLRDMSGPGYRAYQAYGESALVKHGTYVAMELFTQGGVSYFPASALPDLLPSRRSAVLAKPN
jgi:hypothetical protein